MSTTVMKQGQSVRIQTSVLNGLEKKVLVWLAILVVLVVIYLNNFYRDLKGYEEINPVKPY